MLKIVQRSDNKNFGVNTVTQGPGAGVVSYALVENRVLIEGILV